MHGHGLSQNKDNVYIFWSRLFVVYVNGEQDVQVVKISQSPLASSRDLLDSVAHYAVSSKLAESMLLVASSCVVRCVGSMA